MNNNERTLIGIVGLGYVGLPLAIAFSEKYETIGFDINEKRVTEINQGNDHTEEVGKNDLERALNRRREGMGLTVTSDTDKLAQCNFYIVTVPTPINDKNIPVLTPLVDASKMIGSILKKGDIVVYESTVYPGVTEDICAPALEETSKLILNKDFYIGYSPERINPGDKNRTFSEIVKVTSGSTPDVAEKIDHIYKSVVTAGTHLAPSIKVAEAAKVIENSQRDINIAFVNELSKLFMLLNIDTKDVLDAAATKWNFMRYTPGLVGGHCIGVDPYYLAQKAKEVGYHPEIILAGRKMNDGMGKYVAQEVVKLMIQKDIPVRKANILVLGITFKENCPDIRNSKVIDMIKELQSYQSEVSVYDPYANSEAVLEAYGLGLITGRHELEKKYDAIVLAVPHDKFSKFPLQEFRHSKTIVYDVKSFFPKEWVDARL
ncbi:nucleotide sugar dehydrogenase [Leptobacterium sp. I13]|uniref:nucleotide sugar dehydrogenase n=1 Tax=Leptobacterium meishanense TaxID=3128904 RepID=UPI0030EF0DCB